SYAISIEARDFYSSGAVIDDGEPFAVDAPPGTVKLLATADGYLPETSEMLVELGKTAEVTIALSRGRSVHGRVTAASGAPIAEASIEAQNDVRYAHAATDDDGEFELNDLPREAVTLAVQHSGFVTRRVIVGEGDARADVVLSRGRKVTGRVVTSNGEPVAEASVYANSAAHAADSQSARTAENGTFEMEGLADGRYTFIGTKEGYSAGKIEDVDVTAAAPIVIALSNDEPKGALHGTVEGFVGSSAMYGSVIATTEGEGSAQGVINRDGTFRVENVFAGDVTVHASAGGLRGDLESSTEHVTLAPGADASVNLKFRTDITIRGVVTEDGTPATGRRVSFDDASGNSSASASTDGAGAYEVLGLIPGDYKVSIGTQRGPFVTSYQVAGSATFDIRIELSRIEGRVVDEEGSPVSGATIALDDRNVLSDASGAFSFSLPAGKYTLVASKRGYGETRFESETGGAPLTVTLARGEELRVRVVDARDGTTLAGYVVALAPGGNTVVANSRGTSPDGTARIALAAGSYRIAASADGYASSSARADSPSANEVRVALTPGGKLLIRSTKSDAVIAKLILPGGE
ncbi:MAG TPA: carboxypeptidase regulatory-like domain-containing protein, partial [Thermoanaerobaculia bacterium]|nr:carboxypeptidase regulatory-like domain-containing protein [Thermoanaerobaculia bacterium]